MTRKIFFQRKNIFLCMLLLTSAFVYPVEKEAIPQEKPELSHYEKAVDFYKNRDLWLGAISEAKMHLQEHPY
ncbi:MAG: hypothetical protein WCI43_09045, partial [Candidatus Firestonebacteria bacterium]